jgi:ribonuclease VapC
MSGGTVAIDSSAILAILKEEPGHGRLQLTIEGADALVIGAPTLFETAMVAIARFGAEGEELVERFLEKWKVRVLPFEEPHWRIADQAFERFGKGRHPAALNYGDCMSYATARVAAMPLLFMGNDFAQTDIPPA